MNNVKGENMLNNNRIRVIIGHYGSGKTEFALNYGVKLAKKGKKVALADLDIVNPYFRSREKKDLLQEKGITVIGSAIDKSLGSDLPSLSSSILAPLQDESYEVILDVGGNDVGARVLGRYHSYFIEDNYDMFCIINANRPGTQDVQGVLEHIKSMERVARVLVTGLVNNTHLLRETTLDHVLYGQKLVKQVSDKLDIPIKYVSILDKIVPLLPENIEGEIFPIKMYMREEWM